MINPYKRGWAIGALLLLFSLGGGAAPLPTAAPAPAKYLFLVEASAVTAPHAERVALVVADLIERGCGGRMQSGDWFSILPFNEQPDPVGYTRKIWEPARSRPISNLAFLYLQKYKFEKKPRFDLVMLLLQQAIREERDLNLYLIISATQPILGTPFDADINAVLRENAESWRARRGVCVIALVAEQGQFVDWAVGAAEPPAPTRLVARMPPPPPPPPKPTPQTAATPAAPPTNTPAPPATPPPKPPSPKPAPPTNELTQLKPPPTLVPQTNPPPKTIKPETPKPPPEPPQQPPPVTVTQQIAQVTPPASSPEPPPKPPVPVPPTLPPPTTTATVAVAQPPPSPPAPTPTPSTPPPTTVSNPPPPPTTASNPPPAAPSTEAVPATNIAKPAPPVSPVAVVPTRAPTPYGLMAAGAGLLTLAAWLAVIWYRRARPAAAPSLITQSMERERRRSPVKSGEDKS